MSDALTPKTKASPPAQAQKARPWLNWRQSSVLADRYFDMILADWGGTALLLLQAPLLAGMAVLVWGNTGSANRSLYFVMVLSSLWLGCMDACREIVKERALFLRERMFNLEVGAYLLSKLRVLLIVNGVQAILYTAIIASQLDVRVHAVWLGLVLLLTTLVGTCLGLLISAASKRSDYAVAVVPLVILPQILFSEFAIAKDDFAGVSEVIYTLMPSRWSYDALVEWAKTEPDYGAITVHLLPLPLFCVVFLALAWPLLHFKRY